MAKWLGHGTSLKLGNGGSPETFTALAQIMGIDPPQMTSDDVDVTDHSSGGWKEFIQGLKDGGEVTLQLIWDPLHADHKASGTGLLELFETGVKKNWQISIPTSPATAWTFSAHVKSFVPKTPLDSKLTAEVKLRVTGTPTLS